MPPEPRQITIGRLRLGRPAAVAIAVTALFIGFSIWWLLFDRRLPGGGDPGRHLATAVAFGDALFSDDLGALFTYPAGVWEQSFFYPPLARFVGGVPAALGLAAEDWGTIALNLVFVPLLAAGCYGVGRLVYGPLAGALAVVFALGTPIVLSLFHVFLLDAPLAGSVAISLWALLASERFSRRRETVLAGALLGLALLVKTPAPLFLAGPIAVMLIGGGWRQWRNLALMGAAALAIAGPYYLINLGDVVNTSETTTIAGNTGAPAELGGAVPRFSLDNLSYYGWVAVNIQYFVPLLLLFGAGLVVALRDLRRRPHLPELIAGLAFGYLAPTLLFAIRDPRYTLPLVVYFAVIGTGWIATVQRPALRRGAIAFLALFAGVNAVSQATDALPTVRPSVPGGERSGLTDPGAFTIVDDTGYVVGVPRSNPLWDRLFDAAEAAGIETARITVREAAQWGTDGIGFEVLAEQRGIANETFANPPRRAELMVDVWWTSDEFWIEQGLPAPCGRIEDGTRAPAGSGPVPLSVAVRRLGPDGYERWCDF